MLNNNTICAIATASGGAIGIIRISGPEAISIADKIFFPIGSNLSLSQRKAYTLAFGNIVNAEKEVVDEVLVSIFRAPHSYTGEDSVEISCHGSSYVLSQVMMLLTQNGCQPAGPGEFTQRAFLNGKMDLSQAEAVADLISSTNKATHDMALSQLKGHFSNELSELYALANDIHRRLVSLARSFEVGNALKNGIPVAIVGNTNVGKSTLLNSLLHEEKAIVSNVHGTTRDFIEDTTIINGIQFRFVDTAGIRDTDDIVENIGIERTYQKMQEAKIVLWLIDQQPTEAETEDIKERVEGKKLIVVRNKIDQDIHSSTAESDLLSALLSGIEYKTVDISAKYGTNIPLLEQLIVEAANIPQISESDIVITSARHYSALLQADESLQRVISSMNLGLSGDLLAEDLRMVIEHLAEITGEERITPQETLNSIFSSYCIGK